VLRLTVIVGTIAAALVALGYLFYLNPDTVTLQLSRTSQWQAPLPLVLLAAFLIGAGVTFAFSLARESRHALLGWRSERSQRRTRRQLAQKDQGLGLSWLGAHEKARALLARALRDRPDDLSAFLLFARTYLDEGDFRRALGVLEEGLATRGHDPKLLLFLAEAQRGLGEVGAAVETLERAHRADAASPRVRMALRDAYIAVERWADAATIEEEHRLTLRDPRALADAERRLIGLRYQQALALTDPTARAGELRALLRSQPDFEPAAVSLGDALVETGQARQAERVWRRALARGARAGVLDRLERLLRGGPRPQRLDVVTRKLVRRRPEDGTARLFRARQLVRDGRLDEAASELASITAPWNTLPGYHALLAELQIRRGAPDDAVNAYRRALAAASSGVFRCEVCGTEVEDWRGYCPRCGSWASYRSSLEVCKDGGGQPGD
jgi:tetratricopeptide (TPR) repeat protein